MKTPHKHAELIKAWADGAEIQLRITYNNTWMDYKDNEVPAWNPEYEYRIKPDPKPDYVEEMSVYRNSFYRFESDRTKEHTRKFVPIFISDLKFTWDGETGKLKSVEVL